MGLPQLAERRLQRRRRIVSNITGELRSADGDYEFSCRPLDVNSFGVALFTEEELEFDPGEEFVLAIENAEIRLVLIYSMESPGIKVGYRHGFRAVDESKDLEDLFGTLGLI